MSEESSQRNLLWVARYNGRLVYLPHENIEIIISNLDYAGNPIPQVPIRIYRMTRDNEATYIDIDPREDTMADLIGRTIDLSRIVDYSEDIRRQQAEAMQQRLEQQGATAPVTEPTAEPQAVPKGERTKAAFPEPIPVAREDVEAPEAAVWDGDDAALAGGVSEQTQQELIEDVTPVPPRADKVRRRNGNRR
jgi:hypothetical protein